MAPDDSVIRSYRTTFGEYARTLKRLQHLLDSAAAENNNMDNGQLEPAFREVENARAAHNCARDVLARQLGARLPQLAPVTLPITLAPETRVTKTASAAG